MTDKPTYEELEQRVRELETRENRYRLLFDHMNSGFALHEVVVNENGNPIDYVFLEINSAFETLTGLSRQDVLHKKVTEVLSGIENDPADWIGKYGQVALTGREFSFEHYSLPLGRWYSVQAFRHENGQFATIFEDVTESHRVEEALRKASESLQAILDNSPLLISEFDLEGRYIRVNNAVAKLLKRPSSELIGKAFSEILPAETAELFTKRLDLVSNARKPITLEDHLVTPEGGQYFITTIFPLFDASGQIRSIGGIGHNITERKRAEEALRREEEKFRTLLENIVDWVWMVDASGQYTYLSPQAEELLGYDVDEILGKNPFDFMPSDEVQRVAPIFFEAVEKRERIIGLEDTLLAKDGSEVIFETNATPLFGQEDDLVGFMGTCRDITERKKAEEEREKLQAQLAQAHKMEAIGTLAGGIAHDFNNILSIIVGNTELAMVDLPDWSPAQDNLKEVREATLRARELVKQILMFARQKEHPISNIRLEPVVKESLKMLRASIPTTVKIRKNIREGLPSVLADPSQIQQIIMNLCTNAAQVMEAEGGPLTFTLDSVGLDTQFVTVAGVLPPGQYVRLQVKDTGQGIPPENLEKIFDPFFTTKGIG